MTSLIGEIDEFKGAWHSLGRLTPERLRALRTVATIESIGSSTRIEGAKLSDQDIEKLLSHVDTQSFASRDGQEVAGYAAVCEEVFERFDAMPFSENVIKQLHGLLLNYSEKDERHRGEYKKIANRLEAFDESGKSLGVIFEAASPLETPIQMQQLVAWTREQLETRSIHPLLTIGIFVVVFLAIHPFQDGNGRLSRILANLLLLKSGYSYIPYSSLESVIERSKEGYYRSLRKTQESLKSTNPDFGPWLIFFLRALQKQKIHLEQKITRERELCRRLPELAVRIIELIAQHGSLSIGDIEGMTHANRNTLKKYLADLVSQSEIARHGKGKSTRYTLP